MNIRKHVQNFLGISELQHEFLRTTVTTINSMRQHIVQTCREIAAERSPSLACVTFMGEMVDHDNDHGLGTPKTIPTSFGAELFMSPGEARTVMVPVQNIVGRICFFVSGHPNIVITGVVMANQYQVSNTDGIKFGRLRSAISPGEMLVVHLVFRTAIE